MSEVQEPSIKSLQIEMRVNGNKLSTGTGFIVTAHDGHYLITNRHNVTGRHQDTGRPLSDTLGLPDQIAIRHHRTNALGHWTVRVEDLFVEETPRWFEHPTEGSAYDFVALRLMQTFDIDMFPYDPGVPGPEIYAGPAEPVSVVGFPFGRSTGGGLAIWATGFVASEPSVETEPTFLIDCRTRPGQSGSPVIAHRSGGMTTTAGGSTTVFSSPVTRLLGIYSGRINEQSDIGVVWKASAIAELIESLQWKRAESSLPHPASAPTADP